MTLSDSDRRALLQLARSSLARKLGARAPEPEPLSPSALSLRSAAFVTLVGPNGRLRGCIGQIAPLGTLPEDVSRLAVAAGFEDPRFPPLRPAELDELTLEISVLGPMEPLPDFNAIEIGRHGLYVKAHGRTGLLLAKVASQYGWDAPQFLKQTCEKAGLDPAALLTYPFFRFEELSFSEGA